MSEIAEHAATLENLTTVRHAFFTRNGGISSGIYESNNCASSSYDDPSHISKNRAACIEYLGMKALVGVNQQHTTNVVEVEGPWDYSDTPVADAMVTRQHGIALGILTADCAPVLIADGEAGVIAAAHAGWRGAHDGILENTVDAMIHLGANPTRTIAVIGPCIAQVSYEVGPEFATRFKETDTNFTRYFIKLKDGDRAHFDLAAFTADKLKSCGIKYVSAQGDDTCANEHKYFSYRRSILRRESDYGRQLSAIGLLAL
ncbi:MAG TPA: peptidoglycan editing factor PgeF [Rhodospirillaceae bacterium]|nr:peptidoglycan editing factor PgeF [Rhodospirillaceae bacterium]